MVMCAELNELTFAAWRLLGAHSTPETHIPTASRASGSAEFDADNTGGLPSGGSSRTYTCAVKLSRHTRCSAVVAEAPSGGSDCPA